MGRCVVAAQNLEAFPPMTQGEFAAYMKAEFDRWRQVAREGGIEASQETPAAA